MMVGVDPFQAVAHDLGVTMKKRGGSITFPGCLYCERRSFGGTISNFKSEP